MQKQVVDDIDSSKIIDKFAAQRCVEAKIISFVIIVFLFAFFLS